LDTNRQTNKQTEKPNLYIDIDGEEKLEENIDVQDLTIGFNPF